MKKYKIVREFYGKHIIYKRILLFFWEYQTSYYSLEEAQRRIKLLKEECKYKPKVWFY